VDTASGTTNKARKGFMRSLLEPSSVTRDDPLIRFALREDVLAAVADYLGTAPVLAKVDVFYSGSVPGDPTSSQLLHCDQDDTQQIKAFVLCSDVSEENGPLQVMDADDSRTLRKTLGYHFRDRVTGEEAERAMGPPQYASMVGPPGTVCLADTSRCFHYGSRVEEGAEPRLVAMVKWQRPFAFKMPRNVDRSGGPYASLARPDDSRLVQLALASG